MLDLDTSTINFLIVLVILFFAIKYFASLPAPPAKKRAATRKASSASGSRSTPDQVSEEATSSGVDESKKSTKKSTKSRPVTKSMVEIVQLMAPHLTEEQIVYDLNKTGSIEDTINKILENDGKLPDPPMKESKLKKTKKWASTEEERTLNLAQKKEAMIANLRLRMKAQLSNEIDLNL